MHISRQIEGYEEYIKSASSILHNTAFLALDNDSVLGVLEYDIKNNKVAEIINIELVCNNRKILLSFIEEIEYWNPYVENMVVKDGGLIELYKDKLIESGFKLEGNIYNYKVKNPLVLMEIDIRDIKISQLTVSREKLKRISKWAHRKEDIVVNLTKVDDKLTCIDGNTRLVAAYRKGMDSVFAYITSDEYSDFYGECIGWCEKAGINNVSDLNKNVVDEDKHKEVWIDRCGEYFDV